MTHTMIRENVADIVVNGTSVQVTLHDNGELDFENHEHLSNNEFDELVEYVMEHFPMDE